jgi:hypothetical protein
MPNEKENLVPVKDAMEHALLAVVRGIAIGLPDVVAWSKASLRKEPTVIFDLNGEVLFYDFEIRRGDGATGYVRTAANQLVGSPDVAFEIGARKWSFDTAAKKLTPKVRREFPGANFAEPRLICYSYPKLGVLFESADAGKRAIYDVASLDAVPERRDRPELEGAYAWSFLDSLSSQERRARLKRYTAFDEARRGIAADVRAKMVQARSLSALSDLVRVQVKRTTTRTLQYCDHYNETEARSHHCFSLHAQEVNNYCAVATCQMVLCYYRYDYTQDQIAPDLDYSPASGEDPGGCPADQSPGYKTLTCNHLDASFDTSPTWAKGRDEIEARHPFKSGVPGHARACAGHSSTVWLLTYAGITEKKLYIYDPWPWDADLKLGGAVYWEDWDSIEHTNYVTTRIKCP